MIVAAVIPTAHIAAAEAVTMAFFLLIDILLFKIDFHFLQNDVYNNYTIIRHKFP